MMVETTVNTKLLALALLICCNLSACGDPPASPEESVRAWVAQGQQFAEDKERSELMDMISPAYTDARGNKRDDIENMFRLYFLRQQNIELLTRIDNIEIFDATAATFELSVGMAATNEGVLGFSADAYNFEMELVLDDDDWLLISARWGEIGSEVH